MNAKTIITKLSEERLSDWNQYVCNHSDGTFFHLAEWENVVNKSFGHDTYYLMATVSNDVVGVLPLVHVKSLLFGNALVSTPFCVYGGILANDDSVRHELVHSAQSIAEETGVDYIEFRNQIEAQPNWPKKDLYVTFRKEIDPDPEVNLKAIPRRQRRMVRQGIKAGLISTVDNNVDEFYKIYSTSVRNHGTPVFSKKYFVNLKNKFKDKCEIRIVRKGSTAVSAVMSFYYKNEVLPYYGGGLLDARKYSAFDFMYWDLMKHASENGISIFDYGRSKVGTGSFSFKKNWGFEPIPLEYQYCLLKCKHVPEVNPLNPKYQLFIKAWKRLPLGIANRLGPVLAKNLG